MTDNYFGSLKPDRLLTPRLPLPQRQSSWVKCQFFEGWAELVVEYKKEEGCISYNVYQDIHYNNLCYMIGKWEIEEAYQKHLDGPYY